MAGLPRSFGPDVTDSIMRFAVGYPRDRVRDMMAIVKRSEKHYHDNIPDDVVVSWRPCRGGKQIRMCFILGIRTLEHVKLDWDREEKIEDLAFTCDACEPLEMQLQRSRF